MNESAIYREERMKQGTTYRQKYDELEKLTKHELIEMYLKLTPYWCVKESGFPVFSDGSYIIGIDVAPPVPEGPQNIIVEDKFKLW